MSKAEIVKLIWDVESFHGLVLCAKIDKEGDPDAAINCKFEDFGWLKQYLKSRPFTSFDQLPPVIPGCNTRIQIWTQGKRGCQVGTFGNPKKAFEAFENMLLQLHGSWNNISVIWSDPRNKPQLIKPDSPATPQPECPSLTESLRPGFLPPVAQN
jgi:hypothetical protein